MMTLIVTITLKNEIVFFFQMWGVRPIVGEFQGVAKILVQT